MTDAAIRQTRRDVEIIVCIGLEKTGTTTLQRFCGANRRFLLDNGILYPYNFAPPNGSNHIFLAAYAQDDSKTDNVRQEICGNNNLDLTGLRKRVESDADFIARRTDYDRVVVSNEHLHSRITNQRELIRLRSLLERIGTRFRICVVLRRQDRLATSILSTMMKGGRTNIDPVLPNIDDLPLYYRYYDLLDMYESVFGIGSVHVGVYEDQAEEGITLFEIFEDVTGLNVTIPRPKKSPRENPALSNDGLMLLARINQLVARDQRFARSQRAILISKLEHLYSGRPILISRADADRFLVACHEQNEKVRKRWLPDRAQLFDSDTSMWPAEVHEAGLQSDQIERLALCLLDQVRAEVDSRPPAGYTRHQKRV